MSILKLQDIKYEILRDAGRPLVFVGTTYFNKMLYKYFATAGHEVLLHRVEDIQNNSQEWFDCHQFICVSSNVATKKFVTGAIADKRPHYVSIVGGYNQFLNLSVGEGSYIEHYTMAMWEGCEVGNHCTILSYCQIAHDAVIKDYCHFSGYSFIGYATIGEGTCAGMRTTIVGSIEKPITTAEYCNYMINSVVTKNIETPGTYHGNKKFGESTSLNYDML